MTLSPEDTYQVSLDNLQVNVPYTISCHVITTDDSSARLLLEPHLLASSAYGNVMLNNQSLPSNSDYLRRGDNELTFRVLVGKEDFEKYNSFKLSNPLNTSYQVSQCVAKEESPKPQVLQENRPSNINGGFFFAYNETDYKVTIGIGNFFPENYKIEPHSWRTIWVSTDNQDIRIKRISA
ncbi:hypothetical protein GCM10007966_16320 [Legionella impletisoli]|uniref:Uncharacterized protein n=2 Tax=Legionella impletisoli TaxID=343510 RepID=A0A917JVN5_9GAMM|nr:hypothetical protein GCM10007966_16320 [Legionella impletisoli]